MLAQYKICSIYIFLHGYLYINDICSKYLGHRLCKCVFSCISNENISRMAYITVFYEYYNWIHVVETVKKIENDTEIDQ